jgi:hypothetical protein
MRFSVSKLDRMMRQQSYPNALSERQKAEIKASAFTQ